MSQRWRTFCWKLAYNVLPTKENLMRRKIAQNSSCVICGETETTSHLFLYYEVSKRIWSCSSLGINISNSPQFELSTWFKNFFTYLTNKGNSSSPGWAILIATLWAIWIHRNNIIFRKEATNPRGIIVTANAEQSRWYEGFGNEEQKDKAQGTGNGKEPYTVEWEHRFPQHCENFLRINGVWKQKNNIRIKAAYGWVLDRICHAKRIGSGIIFAQSPIQAEAHSLLAGIIIAKEEVDVSRSQLIQRG
ncbi:hypothetical protein RDABS01_000426 [Bienertia sinuspersici]